MTPEEFDRAMEFIIQHLAHFNASLDREQEMRAARFAEHDARLEQNDQSRKRMEALQEQIVELIGIQSGLIGVQSRRLDAYEEWQKEFQRESRQRHEEILDRLPREKDVN